MSTSALENHIPEKLHRRLSEASKKAGEAAEEFKNELSKSKMALNLSQGSPLKFYSSDRLVQLIGNGILTFVCSMYSNRATLYVNRRWSTIAIIFYKSIILILW